MNAISPAYAALIPEDVSNRIAARRHLASMAPEHRAELERDWLDAEHTREPVRDEILARADAEWENDCG